LRTQRAPDVRRFILCASWAANSVARFLPAHGNTRLQRRCQRWPVKQPSPKKSPLPWIATTASFPFSAVKQNALMSKSTQSKTISSRIAAASPGTELPASSVQLLGQFVEAGTTVVVPWYVSWNADACGGVMYSGNFYLWGPSGVPF
jgi:hypothetical protein